MFTIRGKVLFDLYDVTNKHKKQSPWKKTAFVLLDCDTDIYYSWFLEKRFGLILGRPLRGFHFTVINDRIETEEGIKLYENVKERWNNREVSFSFDSDYRSNGKHFWFKVISEDANNIRKEAGLDNLYHSFHVTIGRVQIKQKDFCEYVHRLMLLFPNNC